MVGNSSAGGVVLRFKEVFSQSVPGYIQKCLLAGREEVLTDAAAYIKVMVAGDLFLIIAPDFLFALIYHNAGMLLEELSVKMLL